MSALSEFKKIIQELAPASAGLHLVIGVALVARFLHGLIPAPTLSKSISEISIALLLGLYVRNALGVAPKFEAGIKFALQRVLRFGIILLGLRLSLQDVFAVGVSALLIVVACIAIALTLAAIAGRVFQIPPRLAALIGVGTAICGNSAIVATAPAIGAKEDEVGFAIATITLFGLLAVIFYPLIGQFLTLSDRAFGMWAGMAVNDTSQVVAVGAAYSAASLNIATIVKLTRNTLMAPLIVLMGLLFNRNQNAGDKSRSTLSLSKLIPWFVLGFIALSLVRTLGIAIGVLPQNVDQPGNLQSAAALLKFLDETAKFAILAALASVGLGTNIQTLRGIGLKPFVVGLCVASVLAVVSLSLILIAGLG
ncbi:MAG: putative sulfate exporter family transporter [Chloroflexi bacterium]|nr:putative sulfate exporter family transporter [Chloroflexota bacterium]